MSADAPRRCYYEVLGLEDRKCDDDDIRRGYKRAALRCHPDRNHGNEEAAALEFKEVQNAYTVLIDPDERAWYDSHRDAILRGDSDGTCAPDELNVFDYFAARCYDGFSDTDPKSFFNVYRKVFETIVKEESEYNDKVTKQAPSFGDSTTPWSELGQFYNFWKYFITNKTFAWKDEHKLNEIPDRQYRREAERINQKVRAQARKEYTSAVNQLAHHLYLRDPRVQAEKDREEKEKADKQAEREKREVEAAKRRREANKKIWEEAAEKEAKEMEERVARGEDYDGAELEMLYEKQRQLEKATKKGDKKAMREAVGAHSEMGGPTMVVAGGTISEDDDDDGAKDHAHQYKCNGCKKSFANDKTFNEHVKSGKHKTKFKQLEKQGVDVSTLLVIPPKAPNSDDEDEAGTPADNAPAPNSSKKETAASSTPPAPAKGAKENTTSTATKKSGKLTKDIQDDDEEAAKGSKANNAKEKAAPEKSKGNKKGKKGHRHSDSEDEEEEVPPSIKYQKSKVKAAAKKSATVAEEDEDESSEEEIVTTKNKFGALAGKKKK